MTTGMTLALAENVQLSPVEVLAAPKILTPLPGPKAKAIMERDDKVISPSYTRGYPLVMARGQGAVVQDVDGNTFIDACAGIAVCATGHNHPRVTAAIQAQAGQFLHMSGTDFYYDGLPTLAERLQATMPVYTDKNGQQRQDYKVFFGNSGAEVIDGAIKLARYHTGRQNIVSFYRSFHGRTYGAMSLTASKSIHKKRVGPMLPGVFHAQYPFHYQEPMGNNSCDTAQACLQWFEHNIFGRLFPADELAAIVVEPIQGEGGYIVPEDCWLLGLQYLCKKHGALLIVDEVQSGMGRTGKIWASNHVAGFAPDIMTSAKGLASGLPLGAIIAKADVMNWVPGVHATTFGGNPVACAAAIATLDCLEGKDGEANLCDNATAMGARLMAGLRAMQQRIPHIGDIRGRGLMVGVELVLDPIAKTKAKALRDAVVDAAFYHGLMILGCGENSIRFSPPLVITEAQIDKTLALFEQTLQEQIAAQGRF